MGRIETICSYLGACGTFADVGCDHGYCAEYMLKNALCTRAYITDISPKCLAKAEKLLKREITEGRCVAVCCDGLVGIPEMVDLALIAGMGGEEIIKILNQSYIPENFVFQPMKNAPLLRDFLLQRGCFLTQDDIFYDGKYYFIIKGTARGGRQSYTKAQLSFGKDSLHNPLLNGFLESELQKNRIYLSRPVSERSRAAIEQRIEFLQGVLTYEIR